MLCLSTLVIWKTVHTIIKILFIIGYTFLGKFYIFIQIVNLKTIHPRHFEKKYTISTTFIFSIFTGKHALPRLLHNTHFHHDKKIAISNSMTLVDRSIFRRSGKGMI